MSCIQQSFSPASNNNQNSKLSYSYISGNMDGKIERNPAMEEKIRYQEFQIKLNELNLKLQEIASAKKESKWYTNPLILGIIAAIIGLFGNALNGVYEQI